MRKRGLAGVGVCVCRYRRGELFALERLIFGFELLDIAVDVSLVCRFYAVFDAF